MTEAPYAGTRLRLLREFFGWSQSDVAEMASVTQSKVSNVERGIEAIDESMLSAFNRVGFPPQFFFDEPVDFPHDSSLRFRANSTRLQRDAARIKGRLRLVAELIARLDLPGSDPGLRRAIPPDDHEDIEAAAEQARLDLGLSLEDPISNTIRAVERAGVVVIPLPEGMRGHDGASVWPDPHSRPIISFKVGMPGDRVRMTVAHELGHLVMHPHGFSSPDAEEQAKRFAGAFLLPRNAAADVPFERLTLSQFRQLKATTGVSISGLIMRGNQLGAMSDSRKESLFRQLSARGWRKSEPVRVPVERPVLLERMLVSRFGGAETLIQAASEIHLPAHLIGSFLAPPERDSLGEVVELRRAEGG